jgi:hypothetical protein
MHSWSTLGAQTCHGQTRFTRLTRLTTARIWGKPPPSPLYYFLCLSIGQHPNVILSQDSQVGVSKFPKLGLLQIWKPIILCVELWLKWCLKQSCSPRQKLFNDIWHAWRAPKFLGRPKKGPTMLKSGSSWNLVPLPASSTKGGERGMLKAPGLD